MVKQSDLRRQRWNSVTVTESLNNMLYLHQYPEAKTEHLDHAEIRLFKKAQKWPNFWHCVPLLFYNTKQTCHPTGFN